MAEWLAWLTSNCGRIGAIGSNPSNGLRPNMLGQKGFNPLCQCVYIYVCIVKPDIQTIHRCSHTSIHIYTYIYYIYIHTYIIYTYIYTHTHTYMYTHTHTHTYIYIYIYKHNHKQPKNPKKPKTKTQLCQYRERIAMYLVACFLTSQTCLSPGNGHVVPTAAGWPEASPRPVS